MDSIGAIIFRLVTAVGILTLTWFMMGRCRIGEMSAVCLMMTIMSGVVAGVSVMDVRMEFGAAVLSLFFLGILQCALHRMFTVNHRICQYPVILVCNGRILRNNMNKAQASLCVLLKMLREKGVFDIREVELAMLESQDTLSVLRKAEYLPVTPLQLQLQVTGNQVLVPVIINGELQERALTELGFSNEQILEFRSQNQQYIHKIFAAFMDGQQTLYVADGDGRQG